MADNVALPPVAGNVATDEVAGVHFQKVKLVVGTADSTAILPSDATAGLKVDLGADNDVTVTGEVELGATTLAALETINAAGPLTDTQLRASAVPVSGTITAVTAISNALPAGNNNIGDVDVASIAAGDNNIGNVDVVTLPALVAGTALIGKVGIDQTTPGTTDHVTASLAAAQTLATVTTVGAVTSITNPVTVSSHAVTNAGTFVAQIDGSALTSLQLIDDMIYTDDTSTHSTGTSKGALLMAAANPTDGSVDANDIGAVAMTTARALKTDMTTIAGTAAVNGSGNATGALRVELANNGTGVLATVGAVTALTNALPAGTNNIGDVDVLTTVLPVVTSVGTVTSQADQNTNVTLLSSSATRKGFRIFNDSTEKLYVKYAATATTTDFTVMIPPGGYLEENSYYGIVDGIWAANASGSARITSLA